MLRCGKEGALRHFNPRATRGATRVFPEGSFWEIFQSTRPRGARRDADSVHPPNIAFQSTRPRGARLSLSGDGAKAVCISIHAPTRGATRLRKVVRRSDSISIHAPTRGATMPCAGETHIKIISIHAPTRGATQAVIRHLGEINYFNPRAHEGRDPHPRNFHNDVMVFQSTRPRGARLPSGGNNSALTKISIHAPTRGATPYGGSDMGQ